MATADEKPGPDQAGDSAAADADHAVGILPEKAHEDSAEAAKEGVDSQEEASDSLEDSSHGDLSRPATNIDESDPFALFPVLSLTMSSTRGRQDLRRGTLTSLGRPLTRQETLQTIRTVRSRFTEVRSEFDENASSHAASSF
jgi:hypothetical protein